MAGNDDHPTPRLVRQRIRNRIIEYFELASSLEAQRQCAAAAPVHVGVEVFNQWEDWVEDPSSFESQSGVFSQDEVVAIRTFHGVWEAAAAGTTDPLPQLEVLQEDAHWQRLMRAAALALAVFERRGRLPEDVEITASAPRDHCGED